MRFLLFLFSPVIGIISVLSKKKIKAFYLGFILFGLWLGLTIAIPDGSNADISRIASHYNDFLSSSPSLIEVINTRSKPDYFSPLTMYLFGTILRLPEYIYFGFLGLLFSTFSVILFRKYSELFQIKTFQEILLFSFALLLIPVWYGINNVRFSLAVIIICIAIFNSFKRMTPICYFLLFLSLFIHYAVISVLIAFLAYKFLKKYLSISMLLALFIIFSISNQMVEVLSFSKYLPEVYEEPGGSYFDPELVSERLEASAEATKTKSIHAFFLPWGVDAFFYFGSIYLGYLALRMKSELHKNFYLIVKWSLFFGCFVAVASSLPSFGRFKFFVVYSNILGLAYLYSEKPALFKTSIPIKILSFFALLYNIVKIRTLLDYISFEFFTTNIVTFFFFDLPSRTALIEFLK